MLTVRPRGPFAVPVEAPALRPDLLAAVERASVLLGNRETPLAELFHVSGDPSDGRLELAGDFGHVHRIGEGMAGGELHIDGDAGRHLMAEATGGTVVVTGGAGDWLARGLRGGRVHVRGSAGAQVGSAMPGQPRGMRGGVVLIDGDAGPHLGTAMRRGLIAVGGRLGDWAATGMIAGSVFAFGPVGRCVGASMKRGTVACFAGEPPLLPSFVAACDYEPAFVGLYLRQLAAWGFDPARRERRTRYRRFTGDRLALGLGEVLVGIDA